VRPGRLAAGSSKLKVCKIDGVDSYYELALGCSLGDSLIRRPCQGGEPAYCKIYFSKLWKLQQIGRESRFHYSFISGVLLLVGGHDHAWSSLSFGTGWVQSTRRFKSCFAPFYLKLHQFQLNLNTHGKIYITTARV
jgi:hypothetical protein